MTWLGRAQAGPRVDVVLGPKAPSLERFAAEELAAQLRQLFDAEVMIGTELAVGTHPAILIGSPTTNPAIRAAVGGGWPRLSDQGLVLKTLARDGRPLVVVGGGSPVATLWAVYELGHRFGIRYLLSGDVLPAKTPAWQFDHFDVVLEPALRTRAWRTVNDFAIGPEAWGLEEHRRHLRQLAKLKFNRVLVSVYPWQPFVHYEFRGVKKQTALLWYGYRYPIDGDTAGRAVFRGAKVFDNPDLAGKQSYDERIAAGTALVRGILDTAHELGMSAAIAMSPLEFPREFAAVLPEAKVLHSLEQLVIGPGPRQAPDDPLLRELAATQIRAYLDTYPQLDALYLTLPEFPDWVEHCDEAWRRIDARTGVGRVTSLAQLTAAARQRPLVASGERGETALRGNIAALDFFHTLLGDGALLARRDGTRPQAHLVEIDPALFAVLDKVLPPRTGVLHFVDYTARRVAAHESLLAAVPARAVPSSLILTLADDNVGVLPQLATGDLHRLLVQLRRLGWQGFSTRYWITGDLDPAVHYLARASFDERVTPQSAYDDLVTAMCGAGVAEPVAKGLGMIERATALIDEHDLGFAFPVPGVVMKHYTAEGPPPAWWKEVADLYAGAMNEMYRGKDRSQPGGRPFLLYFAKRLEFAVEYMASVDALRRAGAAKRAGEQQRQVEELEKAVEAMYNALTALGEVARDSCDRGVIAVLNEYGYRPLKREFETCLTQLEANE